MNTHQLLTKYNYGLLDNYSEIARFAATLKNLPESEVLKQVEYAYGKPPQVTTMLDKPVPFTVYGQEGIQWDAIEQMRKVCSIPVAVKGALTPDGHLGYGCPVGGVVALDHAISPSFVGYDIACRMTLTVLAITPDEFMKYRAELANAMAKVSSFGKGAGFQGKERRTHPVMDDELWDELKPAKGLKNLAWEQLGSSGGGNHFFDALIGEVLENTDWLPLSKGDKFVAIMTHSGSRGTGHKLATHYVKLAEEQTAKFATGIPKGYEWLDTRTGAGQEYIEAMNLMGRYAQANHHLIHKHFLKESGLESLAQYENHHNFAWVQDDGLVIHRKGATPAELGQVGIIPGSSGTPSYIVEGLGNEDSLKSSSHGAGRPFSRTEAKKRHDAEFVNEWMADNDILTFGLSPDETLLAYKNIEQVMDYQKDLVRPIAKMLPKVVIMGGASDDGD